MGINEDSVFVLTVKGGSTEKAVESMKKRIVAGADPSQVGASKAVVIPFAKLRRIVVSEASRTMAIYYSHETDDAKESKAKFPAKVRFPERREIAQEIITATGRTITESAVDAGLLSVWTAPTFLSAVVAALTWYFYDMAADLEAGKEVVAKGARKGMQQLFIWIAGFLGTKVILAIGGILIAILVGLAIRYTVNRPQVHHLEFEPGLA